MLFCTLSSVFCVLSAISLYIWDRHECSEYTWSGLVDGCATGSVDGNGGNAYAGIIRSSAVNCTDDYDCELTGVCDLTSSRCIYDDERINRGSLVALGTLCALLAALCGGLKGGCRHAFVKIGRMQGESGWVLAIEQRAWCCMTLDSSKEIVLPHNTRAQLIKCSTKSGVIRGWALGVQAQRKQQSNEAVPKDDEFMELTPESDIHQLWFGKPLQREDADAMVARVNHFLHPEEAAHAAPASTAAAGKLRGSSAEQPPMAARRSRSPAMPPRSFSRRPTSPNKPKLQDAAVSDTAMADQRQTAAFVRESRRRLSAVEEAQRAQDLLALQISEARLVLQRAREHRDAMLTGSDIEAGGATTSGLREHRDELVATYQRLKAEFVRMADLQPQAANAIKLVEVELIQAEQQLEASEQADAAAHQLELILSKQQLLQLLQERPESRDDAREAIAVIDQELWPGGKPIALSRRPRSPVEARARSPAMARARAPV